MRLARAVLLPRGCPWKLLEKLPGKVDVLTGRVDALTGRVGTLEDRVGSFRAEFLQFRDETKKEFLPVQDGIDEARRSARMMYEDMLDRLRLLGEQMEHGGGPRPPRR